MSSEPDYKALFEASPGRYLILDPNLTIVAASDAYLQAAMVTREEIYGKGIFEAFPDNPDDPDANGVVNLWASLERVRRGLVQDTMAVQRYDVRRPADTGGGFEMRYWSPKNFPLLDSAGRLALILHQVEDVTAFVELQESEQELELATSELRERSEEMKAEILRRSRELQVANDQLRRAAGAKDAFLSRMSHELRTPLNAILGFAQILMRKPLDDDDRQSVEQIFKAGHILLELINDVLDVSRVSAGNMSISPEQLSVAESLQAAVDLIRPIADAAGVTMAIAGTGPLCVAADRQRLNQVLLNLLSNAVKYNRAGGSVTVRAEAQPPDRVRIEVADTGIGITAELLPRLFEPFDRLGAESTLIDGSGLGLALAKGLMDIMGGTISVVSETGVGSTFQIDLPAGMPTEPTEVEAPPPSALPHSTGHTVLYIENNPSNIRLLEAALTANSNLELVVAASGSAGIDIAQRSRPTVILLDLHLPDLDGMEVLARLRAHPETEHIPVVVVSADATQGSQDLVLAAGVHSYMTKPLDLDLLETVVQELCDAATPICAAPT